MAAGKRFDCELVIFDKNGTLIDQQKLLLALANARRDSMEKRLGHAGSDLWERIVGVNLEKATIDQSGPLATAARREEILIASAASYLAGKSWSGSKRLVREAYDEADASMKSPYGSVILEGVREALYRLKEHGLRLAIASTDTHRRTVESFGTLGIEGLFDVIVGSDDVSEAKPSPMMIMKILEQTCTASNEAIMVGDSVVDMEMGKNAGLKACIGVLTGFASKNELAAIADAVLDSVVDLQTN